jgi:hypothetical protein
MIALLGHLFLAAVGPFLPAAALLAAAALVFAGPLKRLATVLAVAGVFAAGGAGLWLWHVATVDAARRAGDAAGAARVEAHYQELIRQTAALAAQRDAAAKAQEAQTIAALTAQISDLEATLKDNDDAASQDPDANGLGIGVDSVRRLSAIGHAAQAR